MNHYSSYTWPPKMSHHITSHVRLFADGFVYVEQLNVSNTILISKRHRLTTKLG